MNDPKTCEHLNFRLDGKVSRMNQEEGGPIVAYHCDLTVSCINCGQAFEWFGLPHGFSQYRPTVSIDNQTARLPMVLPGTQPPAGMAGFSVSHQVFEEKEPVKQ